MTLEHVFIIMYVTVFLWATILGALLYFVVSRTIKFVRSDKTGLYWFVWFYWHKPHNCRIISWPETDVFCWYNNTFDDETLCENLEMLWFKVRRWKFKIIYKAFLDFIRLAPYIFWWLFSYQPFCCKGNKNCWQTKFCEWLETKAGLH